MQREGAWIQAAGEPSRAGYFRKRFDVSSHVKHAWIAIASNGGCEVSVNRNPMGRIYLWRPTRSFQSGSSERGQMLHPLDPTLALNFPREYQWAGHDNTTFPLFLDLTSSFRLGMNQVCIEIESRSIPASVSFHGAIELWSGEKIPIRSDESWLGEPSPLSPQSLDWTEPLYWDKQWRHALLSHTQDASALRTVPQEVYTQAFQGSWLRNPVAHSEASVSFLKTWNIEHAVDEAWLRLVTNRPFDIRVNGHRIVTPVANPSDQDTGEWILGKSAAIDPVANPELLDPDEVGSFFVGDAFESPRKADQSLEEFIPVQPMHNMPFQYKRTTNRSEPAGVYDPERTLAESRRTPSGPDLVPEQPIPNALKRDLSVGGYYAYSIAPLLRRGQNEIEIRCIGRAQSTWAPQIAVDGGWIDVDGVKHEPFSVNDWSSTILDEPKLWMEAVCEGPVAEVGKRLPSLKYRGIASKNSAESMDSLLVGKDIALGTGFTLLIGMIATWLATRHRPRVLPDAIHTMGSMFLAGAFAFAMSILVSLSWRERSESIWFEQETGWTIAIGVTFLLMVLVAVLPLLDRFRLIACRFRYGTGVQRLIELPQSRLWLHVLLWICFLCVFLRAYKLDLQPLDDDEYASTQAILAILETGSPGFVADGVYYTRSPLFHYLTAAIAYPFGGNLWSLRLQSVFWSVATAWLTYVCGVRLLGSRWVGAGAMLLVAIHPLEVFTGHVIRFYQMQQFLALLTVYLFCLGFVSEQKQVYRIASIGVFIAAVLSQEITAAMGVPMLIAYLIFANDLGWRANLQLAAIATMGIALIAVDFLAFQSLCLTRTEGVSPSVEATVKPHFWQPFNLASVFIGYSRLHVVLSAFLILGIPLMWKERNRNTLALFTFLMTGILMTNLLVTNVSLRYQYWLFPIWILLGVHCIRLWVHAATGFISLGLIHDRLTRLRTATTLMITSIVAISCCIASFSPWRMVGSYELTILGDSTGCVRFVHSQFRKGDRIAITEPHTHAGWIENGQIDYDISIPLLYDFAVMQDGVLVDRNGGAKMIANLDSLRQEFAKDGRVWVLINREKFRARGKNLRWEYPGARFELFLRKNCELKYRTYLWSAYLWDPARGHYSHFRSQE